jgi:membrane dipeptidase
LYDRGVRALTLTWNFPNALGYPNTEFTHADRGLTRFGQRIVEKMKDMGMVTDVSHLSDQGFWDAADILQGPFVASHSNARAVHHHPRNLTDPQIRAVAELGGVIGLNFCAWFLDGSEHMTLEAFLRHFEHVYRVGGSEVLALGTDFDGITNTVELEGCQGMPKLEAALRQAGYSATVIEKAMYRNALRVFRDTLK